ncbi:nuclear transport factor 2 family protein [Bradyrhizobium sp. U87765 SZCCT0131]|uniref:nuclear transport factor 2 family protein n=1 Tax=unclassified Bradyrhizobium TaxID=2631580 RepID=UPI001BAB247D|nr:MULTISPECIES: nuclear transport factor 2 family protein [unclassified Bradyrhizobium]MBR1220867.1 nuclear transport factor 2 family protein [Bradyrhizobium sp. U87765 SZCCT0131]MBR1260313.1 nuclear transport factor 2 family protein [Bradyrhizobium sp. U87765 SZCCT0134]MBR1307438.1 nuclear transport factor 2 family protein [Bradyrhizobium sp. U87765 SZCCT0110]MBR1321392.1 nuclear transport factor 2 family protein [Bradyrhizobium sp. U87765 SZCCT0109]MBR1349705.1 nuclear transport factor 2 fa
MTAPTSKDLVANAWRIFASRDAARIAALFTPEAEWIAPRHNATAVALRHADHMIGAAAIARFIAIDMRRQFADVSITFTGLHGDGSTVVVEERMQATLPDGRPYALDYCFVFELQDGLISRVREYMDTMKGWHTVFGTLPPNHPAGHGATAQP